MKLMSHKSSRMFWRIFWTLILGTISFVMLIPFFWMLSASMKISIDVITLPIKWIPDYFFPDNYLKVLNIGDVALRDYHFDRAYFNSLKISFINMGGSVVTSALAGYAFAKIKFRGANVIFLVYLATMMIPQQVTMIPKFVMFSELNLLGTHYTLILPGIFTITGTFMMRQYFLQMPDELREAAKIDGATEYGIWLRVMVPLAKPAIGSLAMIVFMWNWNNYMEPLIYLSNWRLYTVPVALNNFVQETMVEYNLLMAASSLALIPFFIIFLIGQKFFIKGLVAGAVKG